jgi:hypothetical protein
MSAQRQEALRHGTDALPRSTVAFEPQGGKILVRYRKPDGTTWSRKCQTPEEAAEYFTKWTAELKKATENTRWLAEQQL